MLNIHRDEVELQCKYSTIFTEPDDPIWTMCKLGLVPFLNFAEIQATGNLEAILSVIRKSEPQSIRREIAMEIAGC